MKARKTPHRNESLSALARVNDQVCFVLFLDAHVGPDFDRLAADRAADFTPDAFPHNAFAERIYVPIGSLPKFRKEQVATALGVSFAFAVEQLLLYIETAIRHSAEVNGVPCKISEPVDACLQSYAKGAGLSIEVNVIRTVKYLRLRRNHVIHAASEPSAELVRVLSYDGRLLQRHWESKTSVAGVDFSSNAVRTFTADETVSLIKIVRICVEEIDAFLAGGLDVGRVLKLLDQDILSCRPELRATLPSIAAKRVRKVKKRALEQYALSAKALEVANALGVAI